MQKREHTNMKGLLKIISLKALFKKGLSPMLISNFPDLISAKIPPYLPNLNLMNIQWLVGFTNAEGHFAPGFKKVNWSATGYYVAPEISISQDNISLSVLNQIIKIISFGKIYKDGLGGSVSILRITGINNINSFIYLFSAGKLYGSKALDYVDFCKIKDI